LISNDDQKYQIIFDKRYNQDHPVEYYYRECDNNIDLLFNFIEIVYQREFSLIYDIEVYMNNSTILEDIKDKSKIDELDAALKKYLVTNEEFDREMIEEN